MIRFLFRLIGLVLIAVGFVALVIDGTRSIAGQRLITTSGADSWRAIHPASLGEVEKLLVARDLGWLWDPGLLAVLAMPTAVIGLTLGAMMMLIGRRNEPQVGVIGRR
ncbi:MAG: hypothetical protein JNK84_17160 [Phreatobacter sp.]|uniref:hypothetical protein n=1 Tax=Phreatobacter sp. TaxID=1966341 RepID=UPI001A5CBC53|nr:hypothetical protein [Phreatobacter sp.]MBL8570803.1 hypothetical protein [Phreatobacter sp.]